MNYGRTFERGVRGHPGQHAFLVQTNLVGREQWTENLLSLPARALLVLLAIVTMPGINDQVDIAVRLLRLLARIYVTFEERSASLYQPVGGRFFCRANPSNAELGLLSGDW